MPAKSRIRLRDSTKIKAIAMDVDGVLTDGGVWWGPNGEEWKRFHFADIMGLSLARKSGMVIALISGENSPLVDRLASKLGIGDVHKDCKDKASALRTFSEKHGLQLAGDLLHWRRCERFARAQHRRSQRLSRGRASFDSKALPGGHQTRRRQRRRARGRGHVARVRQNGGKIGSLGEHETR